MIVLGSCKVGNFVVSTPVLRGLKARFPSSTLGFVGSEVTRDFELAMDQIDWRESWDRNYSGAASTLFCSIEEHISSHGSVDLVINLDGFNPVTCVLAALLQPKYVLGGSLDSDLRRSLPWGELSAQKFLADNDWDSSDFLARYHGFFSSNYIGELFVKLAFVQEYVDSSDIILPFVAPNFTVPDVLIHCTTARSAKIWPFAYWKIVIEFLEGNDMTIGLVGSPPRLQTETYNSGDGEEFLLANSSLIDLRGKTSLIQLAGACRAARAVISVDAGPLHIAAAVGTPTFAIVGNDSDAIGASPIRLWMPRCDNVSRSVSPYTCDRCASNHFRNDECLVDGHPCMSMMLPNQVINWLINTFSLIQES
ncbi:glycosyltransferase family 9 protein [Synechococcus sp. KORDI-100]|uniref:glycosyltransferase family 9 protein n=1 Tax=Synechococcus sp. KORDI-100 TaxID=1280380 RepID=UPI00138DEC20|nr:glycosyltransferase family 9 protein [Synechococcus sp. KORDI-100]